MDDDAQMTIGEVAGRAGIATSAIRYYESVGLLPEPDREHGQRRYRTEVLGRLSFIAVAQQAGLSLEEIKRLVGEIDGGAGLSGPIQAASAAKLPEIEAAIERATAMKVWLEIAAACGCATPGECGLFPNGEADWNPHTALEVIRVSGGNCRRPPPTRPAPPPAARSSAR